MMGYEMLAGRNPFAGRSTQATLAAHMLETPPPVEISRSATPRALSQLIQRCLSKSAADRPQSAREIVQLLETLSTTPTGTEPLAAASHVAFPDAIPATRRASMRWVAVAAGLAVVASVAWYLIGAKRGETDVVTKRVAVVPFQNLTGDASLDNVGAVASAEFSRSILLTDSADVVSDDAVQAAIRQPAAGAKSIAERVARATGAGIVVTGSYSKSGDSLRMQLSVIDARTGRVMRALDPTMGPVREPMVAIAALRERLLGSIVSGDLARKVNVASTPPKYEAYLAFLEGNKMFPKSQRESRASFERAIQLDSSFVAPYTALATTYMNAAQFAAADSIVARLRPKRDRLASVDRLQLDNIDAQLRNDMPEGERLSQELFKRTGIPLYAYLSGYSALTQLKPRPMLAAEQAFDSAALAGGMAGFVLRDEASAYHVLGDHANELATLDRGIRLQPGATNSFSGQKLRAFAAQHDAPAALALADSMLQLYPQGSAAALGHLVTAAAEFDAHGDAATAVRLRKRATLWASENSTNAPSISWERSVAYLWLTSGQLDSATAHLKRALPDSSHFTELSTIGRLTIIAALGRYPARPYRLRLARRQHPAMGSGEDGVLASGNRGISWQTGRSRTAAQEQEPLEPDQGRLAQRFRTASTARLPAVRG
ncbi:MAG: hypothetical protein ABJC26_14910, partial [Gemmatimonadaceae bacterium]